MSRRCAADVRTLRPAAATAKQENCELKFETGLELLTGSQGHDPAEDHP